MLGNGIITRSNRRFSDDQHLIFGADSDIVALLRSTTLTANTVLTGVLEGTPVTPAIAANSFILSNITNDGDILMAASDGGNSIGFLFFDASTPDLYLYKVGGTWTAGATTWTIPAVTLGGTLDANGQFLDNVNYIVDNTVSPPVAGFLRMGHGTIIVAGMDQAGGSTRDLISWGQEANDTLAICRDNNNLSFFSATGQNQQATIVDADGTLADITTKFNTLLADLEGFGLLAST